MNFDENTKNDDFKAFDYIFDLVTDLISLFITWKVTFPLLTAWMGLYDVPLSVVNLIPLGALGIITYMVTEFVTFFLMMAVISFIAVFCKVIWMNIRSFEDEKQDKKDDPDDSNDPDGMF